MASKDYLKLVEESQKKKIRLVKKQKKEISKIYNDIYLKVSKKISKANPNSLSKGYLEELREEIKSEFRVSQKKINTVVKKNMLEASSLGSNTQLDFFMEINNQYNLRLEPTFRGMFAKIPKKAMNEIVFGKAYKDRAGLSERIWAYTKYFDKDIDYIIAEGIANKKSIYEVAKDLEIYVNPNAKKEWDWCKVYPKTNKKIDYNAQRLARTSINHAYQMAQKRSCKKNPYIEGIQWLSSNSHRTCDLCDSRNGQIYTVNNLPLDHPNGLCTTIPIINMSFDEIGEELRSWIDGKENEKLDKWLGKYGSEFIA